MKRFWSSLLCVLLCVGTLPAVTTARASILDYPMWEEYVEYKISGGTLWFDAEENRIVTGYGLSGDVMIPAKIAGTPVKRLAGFDGDCPEITSITMPEGLEVVEGGAFSNCPKLETIRLSSTVRECPGIAVGESCPAKFEVAEGNPYLSADEAGVLYNREKTVLFRCPVTVETYVVPEGVREIGDDAFSSCRKLTSLVLPESLERAENAFSGCTRLKTLRLPARLTQLSPGEFNGVNARFEVAEENPAYCSDGQGALYTKDMSTLLRFPGAADTAVVPEGVREIGNNAFGLAKIHSVSLPESLEIIDDYGFWACANLNAVEIPKSVKKIGESAFWGTCIREAVLPEGLKELGNGAFDGNPELRALVLPDGLEALGEWIFDGEYATCYLNPGAPVERKVIEQRLPYRYGSPADYPEDLPAPMGGTTYIDVCDRWSSEPEILHVHALGLMRGETPLYFRPGNPATRAMVLETLYRLAGRPAVSGTSSFSDAKPGAYYAASAAWAEENGIVTGSGGKLFPNRAVTREEAAVFVYRYLLHAGFQIEPGMDAEKFADWDTVSPWAREAVAALAAANATGDVEDSFCDGGICYFSPKSSLTRIELAARLDRIYYGIHPEELPGDSSEEWQ